MSDSPEDPQVRVVDRRWWARADAGEAGEAVPERKPTFVEELEQRLTQAQEQLQSVLTEHRRAADEFELSRARIRRDVAREVERGRRAVLVEMLEVVDNLDRAIVAARHASNTDGSETLLRGVELVREQFLAKLEAFGVTRLQVVGQPFDPQIHDALSTVQVTDPGQVGLVMAVVKEGYTVGDDLLRPAGVVVGAHD